MKEKKKLSELIISSFDDTTRDENVAIENSINFGQALYILGIDNNVKAHQILAVVLYVSSPDGCYINWLAVSKELFSISKYGKFANDKPFRGMRTATFLAKFFISSLTLIFWSSKFL